MPTTTMTPIPYSLTSNTHGNTGYITQITLPFGNQYEIVDEAGRQELTDLTININNVTTAVSEMSTTVGAISTTLGAISTTVGALSTSITNISTTVSALSTTVSALSSLTGYTQFLGVINNEVITLHDGDTTSTIAIGSSTATVTATTGSIVLQAIQDKPTQEFIYSGSEWQLFGDINATNLGPLASATAVQATYTPVGEITSKGTTSTFSTTGSIKLVGNITDLSITATASYQPEGDITLDTVTKTVIGTSISVTDTTPTTPTNYVQCIPTGNVNTTATTTTTAVLGGVSITHTTDTTEGVAIVANISDHTLHLKNVAITTTPVNALASITSITSTFNSTPIYFEKTTFDLPTAATLTGTTTTITASGTITVEDIPITTTSALDITAIPISTTGQLSDIYQNLQFSGTSTTITSTTVT